MDKKVQQYDRKVVDDLEKTITSLEGSLVGAQREFEAADLNLEKYLATKRARASNARAQFGDGATGVTVSMPAPIVVDLRDDREYEILGFVRSRALEKRGEIEQRLAEARRLLEIKRGSI